MKAYASLYFVLVLLVLQGNAQSSVEFDEYFLDKTMRVDYYQTGDSDESYFSLDQIYQYDKWAGNPVKLTDQMNSGMYYVQVFDLATNKMIYSRGFATLFGEYMTTSQAKNNIKGTYHETILIPYPRSTVVFAILGRDDKNLLKPVFSTTIDPADVNIIKEKPDRSDIVFTFLQNGSPHDMVDLVFVAEGYTYEEKDKFKGDVEHFIHVLLNTEPFKKYKKRFNISGILRASAESGVDEPTKGIFKNTAVNASYNALGTPRYLLIDDTKTLHDIACAVPHDAVITLTNTTRYGGGGIYNNYTIFTADDDRSETIFLHEFGHGFANLADEYFGSSVSYNEFYPPGREPHEPNITLMLDPKNIKWKHLLTPGIEIPTYWGQDQIEDLKRQISELQEEQKDIPEEARKHNDNISNTAPNDTEKKINTLKQEIADIEKKYQEMYEGKIGVFEGAGYSSKGIYRSEVRIGFFRDGEYNKVSQSAIEQMILHLSNEPSAAPVAALPPVIIYKTVKDYSRNVPVILSDDKSKIISFPGIRDIYYRNDFAYPVELANGFLLDRRGINENVAFLSYTYEEYSKLARTPSPENLYQKILDRDPVAEMYRCGTSADYHNLVPELNEIISKEGLDTFQRLK